MKHVHINPSSTKGFRDTSFFIPLSYLTGLQSTKSGSDMPRMRFVRTYEGTDLEEQFLIENFLMARH